MTENERSVLLYRAQHMIEATMLVAMLEEAGIRAWSAGGQGAIGLGDLPSDCLLVDLRVPERDHAQAIKLVEQYFAESEGDGDWTCSECHELVSNTFDSCWKCGGARIDGKPMQALAPEAEAPDDLDQGLQARWKSPEVRFLRTYLVLGAMGLTLLVLAATEELVGDDLLLLFTPLLLLLLAYVGYQWIAGKKDRPTQRGPSA